MAHLADFNPQVKRIFIRATFWTEARIIFRMKVSSLATRIRALQKARGIKERALCLRAGLKIDRVRSALRSKTASLEVLRAIAHVLGCKVSYLIEVAPGIRLDGAADAQQIDWLLRYEDLSPASRGALLAAARSLSADTGPTEPAEPGEDRKRGRL